MVERAGPGEHPDFEFWRADIRLSVTPHRDTLTLDLGSPDCRLFHADVLGRAYRDAALQASRAKRLSYGDPRGSRMLREAIPAMLGAQRGMVVRPEHTIGRASCRERVCQAGTIWVVPVLFKKKKQ